METEPILSGTFQNSMKAAIVVISVTILGCATAIFGNGTLSAQSGLVAAPGTIDPRFVPPSIREDTTQSAIIRDAVVLPDEKLLIVGSFGFVADARQRNITRLNADGSVDPTFHGGSGIEGFPLEVLVQGDGKILVAGTIRSTDEGPRMAVMRLLSDGTLDPDFHPALEPDDDGRAALQEDGKVIVNTTKSGLIRLNPDGTLDKTFDTTLRVGRILRPGSIAIQRDGKILFAGAFLTTDGQSGSLSRFHPDGHLDTSFAPGISGYGISLALQNDGKILLAGSSPTIARLNSDGTLDESFHPVLTGENGFVGALLVLKNGQIVVSGNFTHVNGLPRYHLVRLNSDGTVDPNFDAGTGPEGFIQVLREAKDGLIVGGAFERVVDVDRSSIVRLNNGEIPTAPFFLTQPESKTNYAGRAEAFFAEVRGLQPLAFQWQHNSLDLPGASEPRLVLENLRLADSGVFTLKITNALGFALSTAATLRVLPAPQFPGSLDVTFYPNTALGQSYSGGLQLQRDGKVIATTDRGLVRLRSDGQLDAVLATNRYLYTLALQDDQRLLVTENAELLRLNQDGAVDATFSRVRCRANGPSSLGRVVVQPDGKILLAGRFDYVNDVARLGHARLNPDGSIDTDYVPQTTFISPPSESPRLDRGATVSQEIEPFAVAQYYEPDALITQARRPGGPEVLSLDLQKDRKILIGGHGGIKRVHPDGSIDSSFEAAIDLSSASRPGYVRRILVQADGRILVQGAFAVPNGGLAGLFVRLRLDGSIDPSFGVDETISSAALGVFTIQEDGKIVVFSTQPRHTLYRLHASGRRDFTFSSPFLSGNLEAYVYSIAATSDGQIWATGFFTHVDDIARPGLARLNGDGATGTMTLDPDPLDSSTFRFSVQTLIGRTYRVEWTDALSSGSWNLLEVISGAGTRRTVVAARAPSICRFYRVRQD